MCYLQHIERLNKGTIVDIGFIAAALQGTLRAYAHFPNIALYLSVNVFSTKVLHVIGDTIFACSSGTAILHGHPSRAKV